MAEQWLHGQYFSLLVESVRHYEGYDSHIFEVYIKTPEGLVDVYGSGGDTSPERWLEENDTLDNYHYQYGVFIPTSVKS